MKNNDKTFEQIQNEMRNRALEMYEIIHLAFDVKILIRNNDLDIFSFMNMENKWQAYNLAIMLPYLPRKLVIQHLDQLLEQFMDLNWPGSKILYGYLAEMDIITLKSSFNRTINKAIQLNDIDWLENLLTFMTDSLVDLQLHFQQEINLIRDYLDA